MRNIYFLSIVLNVLKCMRKICENKKIRTTQIIVRVVDHLTTSMRICDRSKSKLFLDPRINERMSTCLLTKVNEYQRNRTIDITNRRYFDRLSSKPWTIHLSAYDIVSTNIRARIHRVNPREIFIVGQINTHRYRIETTRNASRYSLLSTNLTW